MYWHYRFLRTKPSEGGADAKGEGHPSYGVENRRPGRLPTRRLFLRKLPVDVYERDGGSSIVRVPSALRSGRE
jgi:hypothetical protein